MSLTPEQKSLLRLGYDTVTPKDDRDHSWIDEWDGDYEPAGTAVEGLYAILLINKIAKDAEGNRISAPDGDDLLVIGKKQIPRKEFVHRVQDLCGAITEEFDVSSNPVEGVTIKDFEESQSMRAQSHWYAREVLSALYDFIKILEKSS